MQKEIIIIIIIFDKKSLNDALECMGSLYEMIYKNFDVLVVNNGMKGNNGSILLSKYPSIIYLNSEDNVGFAAANNLGIKYGLEKKYKYFLLLNADTIVDKNFLVYLKEKLDSDSNIGIVGPKTYYFDRKDKIWAVGGHINKWRALIGGNKDENTVRESNYEVDYLPGSCILVKREIFEKVGLLPDVYFFAYEEAEFSLRVKKAKYKVVVEPKAIIWHKVGLSSVYTPKTVYNLYRSRFMFLKRNYYMPINTVLIMLNFIYEFFFPLKQKSKKIMILSLIDHFRFNKITLKHLKRFE